MTVIRKTKQNILSTLIITALLFLFGTSILAVTAGAATPYVLQTINPLQFTAAVGVNPAAQSITFSDTSPMDPTYTLSSNQTWLSATVSMVDSGVGYIIPVKVNTSGLAAGTYSGIVTITIPDQNGYTWTNSPYSVAVTLTVTSSTAVAPAITTQPSSKTLTAGQTATFNVAATGTSPMTYQWKKNGTAISSATSSSYTTPAETTADNNAQFNVVVSNSAGSVTSNAAILTVNAPAVAPSITTQPSSQTVIAGQTATFNVAATGSTPMTYQWKKNGAAVSGATSSSYTTPAETTSDNNAQFTITVSNSAGSATSNAAILMVNAIAVAPSITTQPSSQTVLAGQTATFSVVTTGTTPMTYQWMKNGTAVSGATSSSYTTPVETTADNNAKFTAVVSNSMGSATSANATLTVNSLSSGCMTSSGAWANSALSQAATGSFEVAFDATPSASPMDGPIGLSLGAASDYTNLAAIVWFNNTGTISARNGGAYIAASTIPYLAGTSYHFILDVNTVAHTYSAYVTIGSVKTTIGSNYAFRSEQATASSLNNVGMVSNTASDAVCNVTLSQSTVVPVAPTITTQPASQTIVSGQTATFSVAATGTAPLTYQWKNGTTAISGATSPSYTTPAETTGATFSVTVSNSAGSVTSNSATLTITSGTLILNSSTSALNFGNVNVSSSSSQNVTLTNAGTSTVTISSVSLTGAGFSASGVPTGLMLNAGQTATLTATFSPSASGSVSGSVKVASNASNSPDTITLSGTGVSVVNHSAALSWTASTSTVMGYNTYSGTQSGGPYKKLTSTPIAAMSYTDTTVQAGQTYYYVVTSVDSANNESVYSGEVTATIP